MPNWCYNDISVRGTEQQIKDFISKYDLVFGENKSFDFNKIIPEPRTLEECPKKYIRHDSDHIEELEDKPWFNWYDWHCDFWGTKWNACDVVIDGDERHVFISFSTAWCEPKPIFMALKKQNPNLKFGFDYTEEGW